jgi:hypothetical protein
MTRGSAPMTTSLSMIFSTIYRRDVNGKEQPNVLAMIVEILCVVGELLCVIADCLGD